MVTKKLEFIIIALSISFLAFSQSSNTFFNRGVEKYNKQDYKGAILNYSKAIELDNLDA